MPEPEGGEEPGQDPEPDDDRRLGPAQQLEVVVERRHPEHPPVEDPEADDLDDHRQRLDHEQPPMIDQQQVQVHQQAQGGQARADGQRAGVAHEDLGRGGVPPQEAQAGAGQGHRGQGQVEGVAHVVDGEVPVLPVADDGQAGEAEGRRAGGQAVEAVGQVHGVGRRRR